MLRRFGPYNRPMFTLALIALFVDVAPARLYAEWPAARFVAAPAPCLRPADLVAQIHTLQARHPDGLKVEEIGRSVEGRPIHLLTLGQGPIRILLWSQMHGDEPSATPALLDVAHHLLGHAGDAEARRILERTTLLMIPMLNPDGAERYRRRNAQAIDVNRDALNLATPEGRLLKEVRDRHQPRLGFNLHDQNRRTGVGDTGALATIALLAVAGDKEGTVTEGRRLSKRVASHLVRALEPFAPGRIARYDEDWSPRAFGDNLTAWGTPVVLIESGGLPKDAPFEELTRLNFVALLSSLDAIASGRIEGEDFAPYEDLPRNASDAWVDVVVRGGRVAQPSAAEPYRADLAFNVPGDDKVRAGCAPAEPGSSIEEVGDARFLGAHQSVDAGGAVLVPALTVAVEGAARWFDGAVLESLARMGVGRVVWTVNASDAAAATRRIGDLRAPARAAVVLHLKGTMDPPPALRIARPPAGAPPTTVGETLDRLLGASWRRDPAATRARIAAAAGRLALEESASFVVVRPVPGEPPERAAVESVWIDGRRVR
jgi:hypothetical protein